MRRVKRFRRSAASHASSIKRARASRAVEECQTRWRTIRDTYLKRKKRRRSDAKGQWNVLERELSFLDEFLRPRTRRCSLRLPSMMPPVKSELPEGDPCEASAVEEANNWMMAQQQPVLPYNPPPQALQERAGDPDELFCLSLSAQLKRLMPNERNIAKMRMLRVMHDVEFGVRGEGVDGHREPGHARGPRSSGPYAGAAHDCHGFLRKWDVTECSPSAVLFIPCPCHLLCLPSRIGTN
ncbi:hypothetical protein HPB51_006644 [Rhipicephalus microplus]|uniref:BESS domain-containing protein n=1 Tax=Rhipicephalus microplus TaxID=6941 RepID=A0A9J6E7B0_RHIMP|nr:hypothetical protein HPB51_006644 [Rhipicephalus microplus]